jgi:hypothetical protein
MSGGGDFVRRGENDIVKIGINVLNLKMHCQNIVDGRYVQKEFFLNIFVK